MLREEQGRLNRRRLLKAGLALPFALAGRAAASDPVFIADMHFHLFFRGAKGAPLRPLGRTMAQGSATLVSWSLVGDLPWLQSTPRGFRQKGVPGPGEARKWFEQELARIKGHIAQQNLKIVTSQNDVELALKGDPHVVLSVEGAAFLEEDLAQLRAAHDAGIRHIQLVHFIKNPIGDLQTERPEHGGLSDLGKRVVRECNRLGLLVDLAHCTEDVVAQALAISTAPMVFSHGSVTFEHTPHWSMPAWQARQLSFAAARAIAAKGGVVGLWALRPDVGPTIEVYADRLAQLADRLGEDHVAFGTDMEGVAAPVIADYGDLRRVVDYLQRRHMSEGRIRKLAIENYARVLTEAFRGREA